MKHNWEYKKLGEVCDSLTGLWTGKKEPFVNVAVIRNTNFSKDCKLKLDDVAYLDVEQKQYSTRKLLPGDIIVEKSGGSDKQPVGRVVLFDIPKGEFSFSNFTGTLRIKNKRELNSRFLHRCLFAHYLRGETRKLQSKTTGLHNLDMKGYLKLPIPVPPLEEQSRIVAELDLLTGIIDKQNAQLKELDNLAQAIFYDMFGDPIENPKRWEVKPLGNIGKIVTGNTPSRLVKEYYDSPFIEWIKSDNLSNDFMYASKAKEYLSESGALKGRVLPIGSVLVICIAGSISTIGTASSIDRKVAFNQQINAIIPNEHIVQTLYLLYTIRLMGGVIRANATNGMKHIITKSVFEKIPFILPPLALQQSFAEKIQSIEKQKETIRASIADTQKLLDYTMDKYFG